MSLTLDQIVARLEDPDVPVVWLDPSTPDAFWTNLPEALADRGLAVWNLDSGAPICDLDSLLERIGGCAAATCAPPRSLSGLKDELLAMPRQSTRGWVVMFRNPEPLRQNDEATFEDFLDLLELVHESQYEAHRRVFKLVVRD